MQVHVADSPQRPRVPGELLQVGPDNPAANNGALRQANRMLEEQDFQGAERILARLVKEHPRDPEPLASLAVCVAAGRGQFATAEKLAKRARAMSPRRVCGWFALGYINLLGSRIEKGYRYLEEARRRDPLDPRLDWGMEAYEARRPGAIADLAPDNPLNLLCAAGRRVFSDRRVMVATGVYAVYQVAAVYFRVM